MKYKGLGRRKWIERVGRGRVGPTVQPEPEEADPTARYWVGGTGTWNATHGPNWSYTSGGPSGAPLPTSANNVYFDENSGGGTITLGASGVVVCKNFDATGFSGTFTAGGVASVNINVWGNLTLSSTATYTTASNSQIIIRTTGTATLDCNGKSFGQLSCSGGASSSYSILSSVGAALNVANANVSFAADISVGGAITFTEGTLDFNNKNITAVSFASSNSNVRTLSLGSGILTLTSATSSAVSWNTSTTTNLTLNQGTSTIKIWGQVPFATYTFTGGGLIYYNLWFVGGSSVISFAITGANTFNDIRDNDANAPHTIVFPNSTTTVSSFTISGAASKLVTLQRTGASGSWTISKASGTTLVNYTSISRSIATGGATWNASNSTNGGNNTGWNFI